MPREIDFPHDKKYPELTFHIGPNALEQQEKDPTGKNRVLVSQGGDTFFWCPHEKMEWMQKTAGLESPEDPPVGGANRLWDLWAREGIERIPIE